MLKILKNHILTLHEKVGLLVLYGGVMFCFGMGANILLSPREPDYDLAEAERAALQEALSVSDEAATDSAMLEAEMEEEAEEVIVDGVAEEEPGYSEYITDLVVRRGDTFTDMLVRAGVGREEAFAAAEALDKIYNLQGMQIGQKMQAVFREGAASPDGTQGALEFALLKIEELERVVTLEKLPEGGFSASEQVKKLTAERVYAEGTITSSLYVLAESRGIPLNVLQNAIDAYSFDVDFQREIQPGSNFAILYEVYFDESGRKVRDGAMLYASLTVRGSDLEIFRFSHTGRTEDEEYYTADGAILRKTLMKTPISGAAISSSYGMRKHPISGYSKMHKGVDFAAPRGTPIYAAGDGAIVQIGRNGGYGNYIRIRHNSEFDTAYAHMNRFAKGMKRNRRVRQGQVIGYVGSTGRSTGPHLHFEILQHGKHVNPMKIHLKPAKKLEGKALGAFKSHVKQLRRRLKYSL